ncbi:MULTISPECIES: hypothetical protein [unclassified Streptomyces]|uniref:hypothetical protein n=1 Tax=unclassified Streptomyces TaxID=2593676 RepID=UPI000BACA7B2|nr:MULTISPECIES: hypothetical protein [unclassified Streptomyces]ASY37039.1 hypothetical protein CAC01_30865 [Streptomyces sp. CLI2509]MYX23509.1 hypothetical protein [Streptomyces sp. SID8380]
MKPKLSFEEHVEMGRRLASLRDELTHQRVKIANAYPLSGPAAVPANKLEAAVKAIDLARSELENALFREHPDEARTSVYYPPSEERAAFTDPQGT